MLNTDNRRRFTRVRSAHVVRISLEGGEFEDAELDDISLGGLSVSGLTTKSAPGEGIQVQIFLSGADKAEIDLRATIVRSVDGAVAARMTAIDLEAWYHLERLVVLNAEDADGITREFRTNLVSTTPDAANR